VYFTFRGNSLWHQSTPGATRDKGGVLPGERGGNPRAFPLPHSERDTPYSKIRNLPVLVLGNPSGSAIRDA
jgi:hypothetical protein